MSVLLENKCNTSLSSRGNGMTRHDVTLTAAEGILPQCSAETSLHPNHSGSAAAICSHLMLEGRGTRLSWEH